MLRRQLMEEWIMELQKWIDKVSPLASAAMAEARERQAQLAKPPGSLGRLEDLSVQLAGITGKVHNSVKRQHLLVFAGDNGVVEEGVASAPQSVTLSQTINLTRAKTGASTLCKHFGCGITVCDDLSVFSTQNSGVLTLLYNSLYVRKKQEVFALFSIKIL